MMCLLIKCGMWAMTLRVSEPNRLLYSLLTNLSESPNVSEKKKKKKRERERERESERKHEL